MSMVGVAVRLSPSDHRPERVRGLGLVEFLGCPPGAVEDSFWCVEDVATPLLDCRTVSGRGVLRYPAFARLWLADSVKWVGLSTSGLALQLLLIETLDADQADLGLVRSAQWLPFLAVGLMAGALVDRVRRRPVLAVADAVCAVSFATIGALAVAGSLTVPVVAALVAVSGTATVFSSAAHQSFLPRLVPTDLLPTANARLVQSMTAAESTGPLLAGALVRYLSAPLAIVLNAVTYAVSAATILSIRVTEPNPVPAADRHLGRELREGARWVYRHRTLAPYAVALHTWFFFNSAALTVFVFYATRELGLGPVQVGMVLSVAGVSGVLGAGLAPRAARRWGLGRVCVAADWLTPLGFLVAALAPTGPLALGVLASSQLLNGLGAGLKDPLDMSYRNAVTPDPLRARMNATIRSFNWGSIAVSAPLAGWFSVTYGNRPTLLVAVLGLVVAATILTLSPFRSVTMPDDVPT